MDKKELPKNVRDDELSEETKTLISSLPSEEDYVGKLYNYQGCWYYPNTLQGVLNYQRGFNPQDTDIILASLPTSGTTCLKALTIAILERSKHVSSSHDHPLLSNNPHTLVPFLEFELYLKSSTPDLTKFSSPRLFSTHMPLHALKESPCKIVYVCRNVKDVLVSLWYSKCEYLKTELERSLLESLFDSYCKGVNYYGPFWEHVLSYWRGSLEDPKHVLFMRYEEIKEDPIAQVKRLAEFLDCPFTKEEEESGLVDKLLELCSLRNLSRSLGVNVGVNLAPLLQPSYSIELLSSLDTMSSFEDNKTKEVGDSKNHLTPEMESKIDMMVEEKFKGSGLKF